jgi:hypothetical protein
VTVPAQPATEPDLSADGGCPLTMANGLDNWELPGPKAFLTGVADAVGRGAHLALTVPRHGTPAGLLYRLRLLNLNLPFYIRSITLSPDGPSVVRQVLAAVGRPLPGRPCLPSDLVELPALAEYLLVVDARLASEHQRDDLRQLLAAAAASTHATGDGRRTARLLAVLPAPVQRGPGPSHPRLSEHWWWGQCGLLDTTLVVRRHGGRQDGLTRASTVQVAGYDLELAALLAQSWDGRIPSLRNLLDSYAHAHPELAKAPTDDDLPSATGRLTAQHLATWSAGSLDSWEGRLFPHPCAHLDDPARLTALLWRAQVGHILPMLDDRRRSLLRWLAAQGHHLDPTRAKPWELGEICEYMSGVHRFRHGRQLELARLLRDIRNEVAHLNVVDRPALDDLEALAARVDLSSAPRGARGSGSGS